MKKRKTKLSFIKNHVGGAIKRYSELNSIKHDELADRAIIRCYNTSECFIVGTTLNIL